MNLLERIFLGLAKACEVLLAVIAVVGWIFGSLTLMVFGVAGNNMPMFSAGCLGCWLMKKFADSLDS